MAAKKVAKSTATFHGIPGDFPGQCEASLTNRARRCRQKAILGSNVCLAHGARAPQVKENARLRLAMLVPKAVAKLDTILSAKKNDKDIPIQTQAAVARDVLDRNGYKAKDEIVVKAELDTSRFSEFSDDELKQFIAMARRVSSVRDATTIDEQAEG